MGLDLDRLLSSKGRATPKPYRVWWNPLARKYGVLHLGRPLSRPGSPLVSAYFPSCAEAVDFLMEYHATRKRFLHG